MVQRRSRPAFALVVAMVAGLTGAMARADVVTEWNAQAGEFVIAANPSPYEANRALAVTQTAVFNAVNAVTRQYPAFLAKEDAAPGASIDAAVAAANHVALLKFLPTQAGRIEAAYAAALAKIPDDPAKAAGVATGEKAVAAVLAARGNDDAPPESYRPYTGPGAYVPTSIPVATTWGKRKPWLMSSSEQFRPGAPPALGSETWARDYNEIKSLGRKTGSTRTPEQTQIAAFWEERLPPIYQNVVRAVAEQPGREITQNARLFAAVAQAVDDAMIAVFDAKYSYNFWRPVTALRNGDVDGNDATERDASWTPFIDTPMHPEYPCAHCIIASTVGNVLRAEIGAGKTPLLTTTSTYTPGVVRSWTNLDDFIQEVANARIYDGVHFRNSTVVAQEMGRKIAGLAVAKYLNPPKK
jgi:hypothetical protein